ncbi:MAG: sodium-dependent transporter [Chlamydiales bacterium]|nr:sodium-dependent transporter [Chlamydiales bacterium]
MSQEGNSNTWKKESGFIWSILGSAIGFANILSFSAQCYRNGGGAFLIPLLVAYLLLGIPVLVLEAVVGQRTGQPTVTAYGRYIGNIGRTLGWMSILTCLTIGAFYAVLTGYTVAYTYFSVANLIPADTATFFKVDFLQDSGSLDSWGGISWAILLSTVVVVFAAWRVLTQNIQSGIERICSIFMPLMVLMVMVFAAVTLFLPGAWIGISHYLIPDFSRLSEFGIWRDAFGHLFFSLSLGLGIITGYSRYNGSQVNIGRAMRWVVVGDLTISGLAGLVIFACLGFLSLDSGVAFEDLVKSASTFELGFIVFPKVLQAMGPYATPILGTLFFFSLFMAGITGVFSIAESIAGNVEVEFGTSRKTAVTVTTLAMLIGGAFFCTGNGQHILGSLAPMVLGYVMLFSGLLEVVIYFFIIHPIRDEVSRQIGLPSVRFTQAIGVLICAILGFIFLGSLQEEVGQGITLSFLVRWGWFAGALVAAMIMSRFSVHQHTTEETAAVIQTS